MQYRFTSTMLLARTIALVTASPVEQIKPRNVIGTLPGGASEIELKFQPAVDFDRDGCYATSAIDAQGNLNPGLPKLECPGTVCRAPDRLENLNVYSRSRCNNGICAIMYEYYFEKDMEACGPGSGGHQHEWENIVVFTKDDQVIRVSPSTHGRHNKASNSVRLLNGARPKMVYHKDSIFTHCFRHANEADDKVENHTGDWVTGTLVGFSNWPNNDFRAKVLEGKNWSGDGGIRPKLSDGDFAANLREAAGNAVPGFDPDTDA